MAIFQAFLNRKKEKNQLYKIKILYMLLKIDFLFNIKIIRKFIIIKNSISFEIKKLLNKNTKSGLVFKNFLNNRKT